MESRREGMVRWKRNLGVSSSISSAIISKFPSPTFSLSVFFWWELTSDCHCPAQGPCPVLPSQGTAHPAGITARLKSCKEGSWCFQFSWNCVCLGMPRESYLAEQWNTGPLLCLSSYLYASPSLQYLLSLYCCRWKEFIPQGKKMLALAYEPWARG